LQIHPLTIEDCLQDSPLPKMELYDDYLYLVMHAADYSRAEKFTTTEVDFILGAKFLVTMHRRPLKPVEIVRQRYMRSPGTQVRGPDRIAHNVLDLLVDNYRPAMAELRSEVEKVEEAVLEHTTRNLDHEIVELREDLASLRQIIRPQRELALELSLGSTRFIRRKLLPYMRDLHDELVGIEELAISWSEQIILVFRVYLNRSSHEASKGIRVLTTLTAVTIPLLLVGSWFAMNFRNMPLLQSRAAYWVTLGFTVVTTGALLVFLRKRRWF
jgi:magnesium transporter